MRYRLRTLLILLAILPPLLAVSWWKYSEWKAEQERQRAERELVQMLRTGRAGIVGVQPPLPEPTTLQPTRRQPASTPLPVTVPPDQPPLPLAPRETP